MVDLYVSLVPKGMRTLEQVPENLRAAVAKKLEELKQNEVEVRK